MTVIRKIIFGCSFLLVFGFLNNVLCDDLQKSSDKKVEKSEENRKIKTQVKELKSKRGIRFFYMKDSSTPLIHIKIAFKNSGSAYQEKSGVGVPAFYSRAVFQGCGKYSSVELEKEISDIASAISCNCNVDRLEFSLTTPTIVSEKAITLLNTILRDPKFEEDRVKNIQDSIVGFLQNQAVNPIWMAGHKLIPSVIFQSHKYENGEFGNVEDFVKLTIEDLKRYKEKFIVTNNAEACVFGDLSESKAIQLVDKIFEKIKNGETAEDLIPDIEPKLNSVQKKYYAQGPQSTIAFALKCAKPKDVDVYAATIVSTMLGNPPLFKTRIMGILRGKLGYIYSGRVIVVHQNHASYMLGILETDNKKVDKAIAALKNIIKELREKGITEDELKFAKGYINDSTLVQLRSSGKLCNFYFAEMMRGRGVNALNERLDGINNVTLDEVKKFCRENLDENNIPFVIIGGNAQ